MATTRLRRAWWCFCLAAAAILPARAAVAYVEAPYALGRLVNEASFILLMRVEKVDREKNLIIYRKMRDIKGSYAPQVINHNIGKGGFHPREWQTVMAWAQPGKVALFFHNGGASETCIDNYWYQAYGGQWWRLSHAEPYLLRTFAGRPTKLAALVKAMLAGQEVITPCMVDGDKNALQLRKARVQRMRASLKISDYNAQRDFVGWGAEELVAIADMPGFTHWAPLARVGPQALGIIAQDFSGDGKPDLCLFGLGNVALLENAGASLNEVSLPATGGARSAGWADYDGDGRVDLLLATPFGPRLFRNGEKAFEEASFCLPRQRYYTTTAATWIDYNADGRPDVLLADGFRGLRLYRNLGRSVAPEKAPQMGKWHYAGPFDNTNGRGFNNRYPPEGGVNLSARYGGVRGQQVVWREGKFRDGQVNSLALFDPQSNDCSTVYLYRELDFGAPTRLPVALGSDDTLSVWLNGKHLLAQNVSRPCAPGQVTLTLDLQKGKNQLLLKVCNNGGEFAFYFAAQKEPEAIFPWYFEDVTDQVGLGVDGVGGDVRGDHLAVADVNGDGRADVLYGAGDGVLAINTPQGFVEAKDCGISYQPGGITPAFGDYNGDKAPDLFVPQNGRCKLFRNDGRGRFTDVASTAGDLGRPIGNATSAVWADLNNLGPPDLLVGCLRGQNRYFRNKGDGTFRDAGDEIGFYHRIFNTRALCVLDFNKDGVLDLALNNEAQPPRLLIGDPDRVQGRRPRED